MLKGLLNLLNVHKGEEKAVLLLLGNGFFIGVFLASYKGVAYTLFLDNLGQYLREAIFASGGLGVLSTGLYAYVQRRIPFSKLLIINYSAIFLFIAISRVLFVYADANWVIFILYIMHAPIMSILLLSFWGTFGRIFDLRQSKRIIGGIDTGQIVATIIAFFSFPLLRPFFSHITDLLVVGEVGIVISSIFLVVIISNFNLNAYDVHHIRNMKETKFKSLIKNEYIVFLAMFLFFSMLAFSFVEYSFLNVAGQQYPDQNKLFDFINTIEGSILVLGLLIQTFVNERLISMYGLRTTLLVLPIVLAIFTVLALSTGIFYGFSITSPNFIWFFLFITISKLFTSSLREAMENPVFKLFFMPLDDKIRFDIQTKLEGMVNEFSRLIGGGLIFVLGLLPFFELIHYSIILLVVIAVWAYLAVKIYQNYRISIRFKLERQKRRAGSEITRHSKNYIFNVLVEATKKGKPEKLIFTYKILAKLFPFEFKATVNKSLRSTDKSVRNVVLNKLKEDRILGEKEFKLDSNEQIEESFNPESLFQDQKIEAILLHLKTAQISEKKLIAEYVSNNNPEEGFKVLIELMNDIEPEVINTAILASGFLKRMELLPFLIDFLGQDKYRDTATDALINFGEEAFHNLETAFYSTDQKEEVRLRIVGIYGRIGGNSAIKLLWNKIEYPDFKVVAAVINALSQCGFKAHGTQIIMIKSAIEKDISNILWNLVALEKLTEQGSQHGFDVLINALKEENEHNYNHIYMLISMIFDQKSIQLVKENIESRTNEGTTYALELLDVFLPEDIKQKIIPILDDIPDSERIKRLQIFFPQVDLSVEEILKAIVNRDYSQTNRWTKACAFYCIGHLELETDFSLELLANLFNPDDLIKEIAAWVLYKKTPDLYRQNIGRLEEFDRLRINNKILEPFQDGNGEFENNKQLKYSLIEFLKYESSFKSLSGVFLSHLADHLEELSIDKDFEVDLINYKTNHFFFVVSGEVVLYDSDNLEEIKFGKGGYLGEFLFSQLESRKSYKLIMKKGTVLLQIEKNKFYDLVCDEYDVAERIIELMNQNEKELYQV